MIIANSLAGTYGRVQDYAPRGTGASGSGSAPATTGMRPYSSETDRDSAIAMHQMARIMALAGSMRNVDDVSAYALFGRAESESDQYRQAVAAYQDNS